MMARWMVGLELRHLGMDLECWDIATMGLMADNQRRRLEADLDRLNHRLVLTVLGSWIRLLVPMVGSLMDRMGKKRSGLMLRL